MIKNKLKYLLKVWAAPQEQKSIKLQQIYKNKRFKKFNNLHKSVKSQINKSF